MEKLSVLLSILLYISRYLAHCVNQIVHCGENTPAYSGLLDNGAFYDLVTFLSA